MKSIIIGTAGHIDHGKTALVKALTGIDADRLEEEKRRGITIDLGFAHLELSGRNGETLRFGFVDVPGHERFVRNMLAGVGGIDLVLLVIAADEGIKPQTREHFDICRLLGIQHGITALTKSDRVDLETLEVVRLEIADFLRGSFLEHAPILPVSSLKGGGLDELKRVLVELASTIPTRSLHALTRLPIDRVFTIKGFGTVVTGTLISGAIGKEDELELFPTRKKVRVRGVQVHGRSAERAVAGERTALNLAGIDKDDLARGMTLAAPDLFETTGRLDVKLTLLASSKSLKSGARVHFHTFTSETIATVALYEGKQLAPGVQAFARLRLNDPVLLFPGDRFIVRQFSPVVTIGGGVVLDAMPVSRSSSAIKDLEALTSQDYEAILRLRIWREFHDGAWLPELVAQTGWTKNMIESHLSRTVASGDIVRIGDLFMHGSAWEVLKTQAIGSVEDFHRKNPLASGVGREELRVQTDAGKEAFDAIIAMLVGEKKIEITGDLVRLSGRGVTMRDDEAESRRAIEEAFASAGLQVPALKDVLAGLRIDKARAQKIVTLLLREKALIKVSEGLVFHRNALDNLRQRLAAQKAQSPKIDVGAFKDLTGVSRKYAIPLLEYLDRQRVTRRVGDERVIL
jgi:selenocysteine-specific elongation factor